MTLIPATIPVDKVKLIMKKANTDPQWQRFTVHADCTVSELLSGRWESDPASSIRSLPLRTKR